MSPLNSLLTDSQLSIPNDPPPTNERTPILKCLLSTNGSITLLLEAFFGERQRADKLSEEEVVFTEDHPDLKLRAGDNAMERVILLRGTQTQRAYLHATTLVALDKICPEFRKSLQSTQTPIGRLWDDHKMELFKEMLRYERQPAGDLAESFDIAETDLLISRTYRVYSDNKCIMLITESFPESLA